MEKYNSSNAIKRIEQGRTKKNPCIKFEILNHHCVSKHPVPFNISVDHFIHPSQVSGLSDILEIGVAVAEISGLMCT